jgi:hypothetical protein
MQSRRQDSIPSDSPFLDVVNRQAVNVLLAATMAFLRTNNVSKQLVLDSIRLNCRHQKPRQDVRQFRRLARAYEDMGIVMSTWFSSPKFLNEECLPLSLKCGSGRLSISSLVRASRVSISPNVALELMRRSPSIQIDSLGNALALRREFVLPDFAVPRAALVMERYLDTLHKNSSPNRRKAVLLLERNCHVPEVNLRTVAPILRDIKKRGSAYIDSVNGDLEGLRKKRSRRKGSGEMSVHIFAWTRLSRPRKPRVASKMRT